eukprot:3050306-Amphidinium_carterae.1
MHAQGSTRYRGGLHLKCSFERGANKSICLSAAAADLLAILFKIRMSRATLNTEMALPPDKPESTSRDLTCGNDTSLCKRAVSRGQAWEGSIARVYSFLASTHRTDARSAEQPCQASS